MTIDFHMRGDSEDCSFLKICDIFFSNLLGEVFCEDVENIGWPMV